MRRVLSCWSLRQPPSRNDVNFFAPAWYSRSRCMWKARCWHAQRTRVYWVEATKTPRKTVCRVDPASYTTSAMLLLHFHPLSALLSNNTKSAGWPGARLRAIDSQPMTSFARDETVSCMRALEVTAQNNRVIGYIHRAARHLSLYRPGIGPPQAEPGSTGRSCLAA